MRDARWPLLREILVKDGWTWRDGALHAPNDTMWFTPHSSDPDYAEFRDKMSETVENVDHGELRDDLVSLVNGLDAVLRGN